jgi:hypothetical protein
MPALTPVDLIRFGVVVLPRYRRRSGAWTYARLPDRHAAVVLPNPHDLMATFSARMVVTPPAVPPSPDQPESLDDDATRSRS